MVGCFAAAGSAGVFKVGSDAMGPTVANWYAICIVSLCNQCFIVVV